VKRSYNNLFKPKKSIFLMNSIETAKEIVNEVSRKIKRIYWTNEEIDKYFAKRSAKEILDSEQTGYRNPCLDLTLVSAYLFSANDIKHNLVIEEHLPTKDFNFNRLHFVIEYSINGGINTLNYKTLNKVYLSEGEYSGRKDIPRASMIKIPGETINPYKSIYENLGYRSLDELTKNKFIGYSLEKNLNRLKQDNFRKNYEMYNREYGDNLNIIILPQNQPSP